MRKTVWAGVAGASAAFLLLSGVALAAPNPSGSGQPDASCEVSTIGPHGFDSSGFANAETVYAGSEGTQSAANGNSHAVSQYDVACYQLTN